MNEFAIHPSINHTCCLGCGADWPNHFLGCEAWKYPLASDGVPRFTRTPGPKRQLPLILHDGNGDWTYNWNVLGTKLAEDKPEVFGLRGETVTLGQIQYALQRGYRYFTVR